MGDQFFQDEKFHIMAMEKMIILCDEKNNSSCKEKNQQYQPFTNM